MKNELINYLKENLDPDSAKDAYKYYLKGDYLLQLNNYLRNKTNEIINVSYGNLNSPHFLLLDDNNNTDFVSFLRMLFSNINTNFHDYYTTPYQKTSSDNLNKIALEKELQVIKPYYLYTFLNLKTMLEEIDKDKNIQIKYIDKDKFNKMYELMNKKDLTQEEKNILMNLKQVIWDSLKTLQKGN